MHVFEITDLLPAHITVLTAEHTNAALALVMPEEAALIARAIDKRRREFATGRALARVALGRLGEPAVAIPSAPDRSPVWPDGIAGSISHCDTRAVVAIGRRDAGTVGVDVEHRAELKRDLWSSVFLPSEIACLEARWDAARRGRMALVFFSAKEALYKAQYPWTTKFMGFSELEVDVHEESSTRGALACTFQGDVGRFARGTVARGRYDLAAFRAGPEIVTGVAIA